MAWEDDQGTGRIGKEAGTPLASLLRVRAGWGPGVRVTALEQLRADGCRLPRGGVFVASGGQESQQSALLHPALLPFQRPL